MNYVRNCPFCDSENTMIMKDEECNVLCMDCRASGPVEENMHKAIEAWNERPLFDTFQADIANCSNDAKLTPSITVNFVTRYKCHLTIVALRRIL